MSVVARPGMSHVRMRDAAQDAVKDNSKRKKLKKSELHTLMAFL